MTSHDDDFVRDHATRVAILADGVVAESGDPRRVLADPQHDATRALLSVSRRVPGGRPGQERRWPRRDVTAYLLAPILRARLRAARAISPVPNNPIVAGSGTAGGSGGSAVFVKPAAPNVCNSEHAFTHVNVF